MSRVLVIEDSAPLGRMLAVTLERAGHTSMWVADAAGALALASEAPAEVALLDLHLGDGSGPEIATALRELCPGIRVVAMSGDLPAPAIASQFDQFLLKPVALDVVLACINK